MRILLVISVFILGAEGVFAAQSATKPVEVVAADPCSFKTQTSPWSKRGALTQHDSKSSGSGSSTDKTNKL